MRINSKSFDTDGIRIPAFEIENGQMIRFWVNVISKNPNQKNVYKIVETAKNILQLQLDPNFHICKNQTFENPFLYYLLTTGKYLKNTLGLDDKDIQYILNRFKINPDTRIRNLDSQQKKILSIVIGFHKNQYVIYDYYGFGPVQEKELTKFVMEELEKGKSAISFDNQGLFIKRLRK
ncbi:hypothetical protein FUAX_05090 [Fulvitalea axinellae]|uniref:Uncharacterized protein n=1 Tax=Fulvitalea axinellae TaxID=1182444 RepID=A0AAU9CRU3_9BACT|nr:hypothetical protein FUAX_05090 [Fulvitalea axinellae]